ncbi:uncharacterized protein LOC128998905 [Macrosteles quadrilineatus]|uniref:uncharacterized protein LOC128998905 n=1 Tax=Macrosteles quadrilineatus TaxID=74068 RepID=UPI0023E0B2D0|nr:uncharacterized protein LOC128998905 [Macrosteles quadrilineatus]
MFIYIIIEAAIVTSSVTAADILRENVMKDYTPQDMTKSKLRDIAKWATSGSGFILILLVAFLSIYLSIESFMVAYRKCRGLIRDYNAMRYVRIEEPRHNAASTNPPQCETCFSLPNAPSSPQPIPQAPGDDEYLETFRQQHSYSTRHVCQSPFPLQINEDIIDIFDEEANDIFHLDSPER